MPASAARVAANTTNAAKSTGPVTTEGKLRASRNALRHGLTSRAVVLPNENRDEYEALHAEFSREWAPVTDYERELLAHMVDSWWRLQRAHRVEAAFLTQRAEAICETNSSLSGDDAIAMMFSDHAESAKFRLFLRYLAGAEKAWHAALKAYRQVREERMRREADDEMLQSMLELAEERAAQTKNGTPMPETAAMVGFVSQHAGAMAGLNALPALTR